MKNNKVLFAAFILGSCLFLSISYSYRKKISARDAAMLTQKLDQDCHIRKLKESCDILETMKAMDDHSEQESCKTGNMAACHAIGGVAHAVRNYEKAAQYWRIACEAGENEACSNTIIDLMLLHRYQDAIPYGEKTCTPATNLGCYNLACAYCKTGNPAGAIKALEQDTHAHSSDAQPITKKDINTDVDLECIRNHPRVAELFGPNP